MEVTILLKAAGTHAQTCPVSSSLGEGEQVGDSGLLDVGDVDRLVHLALDLPHEALLAHDHLEGGLEVDLDSRGDVLHVIQTLVPPVHLKRPLMVHNHNVVVVLELGIFKLYPDMVGESLGPDDGADPEAGVLGLQLGDAGVDGGGVVAVQVGVLLLLGLLHDDTGGTAGGVQEAGDILQYITRGCSNLEIGS